MERRFIEEQRRRAEDAKSRSRVLTDERYEEIIQLLLTGTKLKHKQWLHSTYALYELPNNTHRLVHPLKKNGEWLHYVKLSELFPILKDLHLPGHGMRDRMEHKLRDKYANITRSMIESFLSHCEGCALRCPKSYHQNFISS